MNAQHRFRWTVALLVAAMFLAATASGAAADPPANDSFLHTWERTDRPVADTVVSRTWMWGPQANTGPLSEPYAESPGSARTVQYYDKSRMEITHPDAPDDGVWYVTNGLLVVELMTGRLQIGDNAFEQHGAAAVNVAGDADYAYGPTYATMALVRDAPPYGDGATITTYIARDAWTEEDEDFAAYGVTAAYRVAVPGIDHQIASPFWSFMNSTGTVYVNGGFSDALLFVNPFYATGYPITEAYWAQTRVAGTSKNVLVQCFERRCLTYTPDNPPGWQVEAGNVGQHYYRWRYEQIPAETYRFDLRMGGEMDRDAALVSPSGIATDAEDNVYVSDAETGLVQKFDASGRFLTRWSNLDTPAGLEVGPDGRVWVTDRSAGAVRVFTSDGELLFSFGAYGDGTGQFLAPTDLALDSAGYVFVVDAKRDRVLIFDSTGAFVEERGGSGSAPGQLKSPESIAIDPLDRIWIADTDNNRIQAFTWDPAGGPVFLGQTPFDEPTAIAFDRTGIIGLVASGADDTIHTYYMPTGAEGPTLGSTGDGDGEFDGITGIATTGEGAYVADAGNARIQAFNESGEYVDQWSDDRRGRFDHPMSLAFDIDGHLIVTDQRNSRLVVLSTEGEFIREYGGPGSAIALNWPADAAVDAAGNIYIVDQENDRIVKLDPHGGLLLSWGGSGTGPGEFDRAERIAVDATGAVYVTDSELARVQKFTNAGGFLAEFGNVEGPGLLSSPLGIAAYGERIYVSDRRDERVHVYDLSGNWLETWGDFGVSPGQFSNPAGIDVDASGDVYVADADNQRVQRFGPHGEFRAEIGTIGIGDGQFDWPVDVLVDPTGALYVADGGRSDIQRFVPVD